MKPTTTRSNLLNAAVNVAIASTVAPAVANTWTGPTSTDFSDGTNWSTGTIPAVGTEIIVINNVSDVTPNAPILTTSYELSPDGGGGDGYIGGSGTGTLDVNAGGVLNGNGNWIFVGQNAGVGTLNVNSGGIVTSDNDIRVGRDAGATGTLNINGGATVTVDSIADDNQGNNTFTISDDANVTTLNDTNLRNLNLTNITGTISLGGSPEVNGSNDINGGSFSTTNEFWVANGAGIVGDLTLTAGSISANDWIAVGRDGGTGVLNINGGTVTEAFQFMAIGSNLGAGDGDGTVNQTAGDVSVPAIRMGENGASVAAYNISGGTLTCPGAVQIGWNNTTTGTFTLDGGDVTTGEIQLGTWDTGDGTLNLNGGTLSCAGLRKGDGTSTLNLNGTPITLNANAPGNFLAGGEANLNATTTIDTAGFDASGDALILGAAGQGLIKQGAGELALTRDDHDISGDIDIQGGSLTIGAGFTAPISGNITMADGTGLGVVQVFAGDIINPFDLTFGATTSTLNLDYGDAAFTLPFESIVVENALNLSGTITVNISGDNFADGTYVLIDYSTNPGAKTGSATWVLGTLPTGISATSAIIDTGSTIEVDLVAPAPLWTGAVDNNWDLTTQNWEDQSTLLPTTFGNGNKATFDDSAGVGPHNISVTTNVSPALAIFNNQLEDYTLTDGGGVIEGAGSLQKNDTGGLSISSMLNTYTGVTTLNAGTTTVDTFTDGGVPSALGAATNDPANLVLGGGTLHYTGAATSSDRGITQNGFDSGLINDNDLTLSGTFASLAGGTLTSTGAGSVTVTNPGVNNIAGLRVNEGTWTFQGGGTQLITHNGELHVGAVPDVPANMVVDAGTVNLNNWLAVSRGNGNTGTTSSLTLQNGAIVTAPNMSCGWDNNLPNDVNTIIDILSGSTLNSADAWNIAESANSDATVTVSGGSTLEAGRLLVGMGENSVAQVIVNDTSGIVTHGSWSAVGAGYNGINCSGSVTMNDASTWVNDGNDFNIADVDNCTGTLNINGTASVDAGPDACFIGKGNNTATPVTEAHGIVNIAGGSFTSGGLVRLGATEGATGDVNISSGSFTQSNAGSRLIVGENGIGNLNVSGTGTVLSSGTAVTVGQELTAVGVINLNGTGSLSANSVVPGTGSATVNFDGGTLSALAANANFLTVPTVVVGAGGGTLDTGGFAIGVTANMTGAGTLAVDGAGTVTTATNTVYSDAGILDVKTGSVLDLNYAGIDQVTAFYVNGVDQGTGIFDATTHPGVLSNTGQIQATGGVVSPFVTWIGGFPVGGLNGPDDDADGSGQPNKVEFAHDGDPSNSSSNAKVFQVIEDTDADGDGLPELVLYVAARTANSGWSGNAPATTTDDAGFVVDVWGGTAIPFNGTVTQVTPNGATVAGLPALTSGDWTYYAFSLDGSNGFAPGVGIMRTEVN